jgi:signal transduction histidine kinase
VLEIHALRQPRSRRETVTKFTDMSDASSAGASTWERDLYAHLTSHAEGERGLLQEYRSAADTSPSKALRYLVNLLIEDEMRHHRIFTELAESLKNEALLGGHDPIIPYLDLDQAANRDGVIDLTDQLLKKEQKDAQELKRIGHELHDVKDTTLWGLLIDVMQRDTDKHIAILRFAKKHTKQRKR